MEKLEFNSEHIQQKICYTQKPVIKILEVYFSVADELVEQIPNSNINIKLTVFNHKNDVVGTEQFPLSFSTHIDPYKRSYLHLEINKTFQFFEDFNLPEVQFPTKWELELTINNLILKENDLVTISYMDTNYIKKRVDDWENRVHDLIEKIKEWSSEIPGLEIKTPRKYKMHEGLMKGFDIEMREIEMADILKNSKLLISLRPYGLWIIGANGRVDLLSAKGNYILIDEAEIFQTPIWKLFVNTDKEKGVIFEKDEFFKLIEL